MNDHILYSPGTSLCPASGRGRAACYTCELGLSGPDFCFNGNSVFLEVLFVPFHCPRSFPSLAQGVPHYCHVGGEQVWAGRYFRNNLAIRDLRVMLFLRICHLYTVSPSSGPQSHRSGCRKSTDPPSTTLSFAAAILPSLPFKACH